MLAEIFKGGKENKSEKQCENHALERQGFRQGESKLFPVDGDGMGVGKKQGKIFVESGLAKVAQEGRKSRYQSRERSESERGKTPELHSGGKFFPGRQLSPDIFREVLRRRVSGSAENPNQFAGGFFGHTDILYATKADLVHLTAIIHLYILLDMDTTILIKTKKDLKLQAQALASDLGFSLTDIINASLRQFVINQGMVISKIPTAEFIKKFSKQKTLKND